MDKLSTIKTETESLLSKMVDKFSVEVVEEEGIFQVIMPISLKISALKTNLLLNSTFLILIQNCRGMLPGVMSITPRLPWHGNII